MKRVVRFLALSICDPFSLVLRRRTCVERRVANVPDGDLRRVDTAGRSRMPFYEVVVEGRGIQLPDLKGPGPITGFVTACRAFSRTREAAGRWACERVQAEWRGGMLAEANLGAPPELQVRSTREISAWQRLRLGGRGRYQFESSE